jgi:hypothetical protein
MKACEIVAAAIAADQFFTLGQRSWWALLCPPVVGGMIFPSAESVSFQSTFEISFPVAVVVAAIANTIALLQRRYR